MRVGRSVTVVIQRDGATHSRTVRLRLWALKLVAGVVGAAAIGLVLVAVFYGPLVRAAARVPGLEREVARLRADNAKVRELSAALDSVEQRYAQVRRMIGADIVPDPAGFASTLPVAPAIRARIGAAADGGAGAAAGGTSTGAAAGTPGGAPAGPRAGSGAGTGAGASIGTGAAGVDQRTSASRPGTWPLDESGYLTRGQVGTGSKDEAHPGIDVAVPAGSLVRASGGGTVRQVGDDPEYGLFVLLDHPDEYQTMYGHLSRILVAAGATVAPGEVIGLSGNTGRSTAPHLHFEIRQRGLSLDPLTFVKEGR